MVHDCRHQAPSATSHHPYAAYKVFPQHLPVQARILINLGLLDFFSYFQNLTL